MNTANSSSQAHPLSRLGVVDLTLAYLALSLLIVTAISFSSTDSGRVFNIGIGVMAAIWLPVMIGLAAAQGRIAKVR